MSGADDRAAVEHGLQRLELRPAAAGEGNQDGVRGAVERRQVLGIGEQGHFRDAATARRQGRRHVAPNNGQRPWTRHALPQMRYDAVHQHQRGLFVGEVAQVADKEQPKGRRGRGGDGVGRAGDLVGEDLDRRVGQPLPQPDRVLRRGQVKARVPAQESLFGPRRVSRQAEFDQGLLGPTVAQQGAGDAQPRQRVDVVQVQFGRGKPGAAGGVPGWVMQIEAEDENALDGLVGEVGRDLGPQTGRGGDPGRDPLEDGARGEGGRGAPDAGRGVENPQRGRQVVGSPP